MDKLKVNTQKVRNQNLLDQCIAIRLTVFVDEQKVPLDEELDEFDVHPEACNHFLTKVDGVIAATGRSRIYDAETQVTYKLQRIAVLAEFRGCGIGRELVQAMEHDAVKSGAQFTLLDAQCQAEPFYKKLGYVTLSEETFLDAGIPHVQMKKKLLL
ncbi:MAG: GNAT family N-acetyltransferase [Gorillibacterium sp.]|nr:GNAT family N-acetyltransferase [Gorillibacterium sp.]